MALPDSMIARTSEGASKGGSAMPLSRTSAVTSASSAPLDFDARSPIAVGSTVWVEALGRVARFFAAVRAARSALRACAACARSRRCAAISRTGGTGSGDGTGAMRTAVCAAAGAPAVTTPAPVAATATNAMPARNDREGRCIRMPPLDRQSTANPERLARRLGGLLAERDLDGLRRAVARDRHGDLLPGRETRDRGGQVVAAGDLGVAHLRHDVAGLQARLAGRAVRRDGSELRAARPVGDADAEVRVLDRAALAELPDDPLHRARRDREAQAGPAGRLAARALRPTVDLRVHADDLALGIEQRAAGVAGVELGVGLDGVGDGEAVGRGDLTVQLGDHAGRQRALQLVGAADRVDVLADREAAVVAQRQRGQAVRTRIDAQEGEIGR